VGQRAEQDVGEGEVEGCASAKLPVPKAGSGNESDECRRAVEPRICPCDSYGPWIDVTGDHACAQRFGRRNRQHARSGPNVENAQEMTPFHQSVEREQAAPSGAMVARAEGQGCFDFDGNSIDRDVRPVVGAVDQESAGGYRRQRGERGCDPVAPGKLFKTQAGGGLLAGDRLDRSADGPRINAPPQVHLDLPARVGSLKEAYCRVLQGKAVNKRIPELARGRLVTRESGHGRRPRRVLRVHRDYPWPRLGRRLREA
jgi:hypothetical protein